MMADKQEEQEHLGMANTANGGYVMFCLHCGQRHIPVMPIPMDKFSVEVNGFMAEHKDCKPGDRIFTVEQMKMV
ncbi:MAG: hypothetical protein KA314_04975 [Chloroflexi bacterium]|nr:hypothetical protein [Chloroflexota bacterium]